MGLKHAALFADCDLYELETQLGSGSDGVVYRALDRQSGERVALKVLRRQGRLARASLEREIERLSTIRHHNLVQLGTVGEHDSHLFYTMQLVEGVDFLRFVRGGDKHGVLDEQRLRDLLPQLIASLASLHRAFHVHRDVKPANVRVSDDGRLVLLDLGIAAELGDLEAPEAGVGTPAYMSPEQVAGEPTGPPSDWYAVGVMLYEALTGVLPHPETAKGQTLVKLRRDPTPPDAINRYAPADLCELCCDLLHRDPDQRPVAAQILHRLGASAREVAPVLRAPRALFGREEELEALHRAYRAGMTIGGWVHVQGPGGIGKSTLVHHFLDELAEEHPEAALIRSHCDPEPTSAYPGLDELVAGLVDHLNELPPDALGELPMEHISWLRRLFPVVQRVASLNAAGSRASVPDPIERRFRALHLLRALFARLATRRPLVLFIDEAHWATEDTLHVLEALTGTPSIAGMLLITASETRPWPRMASAKPQLLPLAPLSDQAASELSVRFWNQADHGQPPELSQLVSTSNGEPWRLLELLRFRMTGGEGTPHGSLTVRKRIAGMPTETRMVLQVVCVAGRPVGLHETALAARIDDRELARHVARLRDAALIERWRTQDGVTRLWPSHANVVQCTLAQFEEDALLRTHRHWAQALAGEGPSVAYARFVHHRACMEQEAAAEQALAVADQAAQALAFERAACMHRAACELSPPPDTDGGRERLKSLALSLELAGHYSEAAEAYERAARLANATEALELQRRRARLYLHGADGEAGKQAMRDALQGVGLTMPENDRAAIRSLLGNRAWLSIKGLGFRPRSAHQLSPRDLAQVDVLWSLSLALAMIDALPGAALQQRGVRLALRTGEPLRIARALMRESMSVALSEGPPLRKAKRLLEQALSLGVHEQDAYLRGMERLCRGSLAVCESRPREAAEHLDQAQQLFRSECSDVGCEIATAQQALIQVLIPTAEFAELKTRTRRYRKEARNRGDRFAFTNLTLVGHVYSCLAEDDPQGAREAVDEVMDLWPSEAQYLQHFMAVMARYAIGMYLADGELLQGVQKEQARWSPSVLSRAAVLRASMRYAHSGAMLVAAQHATGAERAELLGRVRRECRSLRKSPFAPAPAWYEERHADLAILDGDRASALGHLAKAREVRASIGQDTTLVELQVARVRGGVDGQVQANRACEALRARSIRNPLAFNRAWISALLKDPEAYLGETD